MGNPAETVRAQSWQRHGLDGRVSPEYFVVKNIIKRRGSAVENRSKQNILTEKTGYVRNIAPQSKPDHRDLTS
jgi:hypothetical protein